MKSLAFSEISSKASSSKSQVAEVTLDKVSLSLSPMKGDKPLSLGTTNTQPKTTVTKIHLMKIPCLKAGMKIQTASKQKYETMLKLKINTTEVNVETKYI